MNAHARTPAIAAPAPLVDPFGRTITYLRVSVTDRCDFRCVYCMAEHMTFLPKARPADAGGARPAVRGLRRASGVEQAAHHRRRAAGAPQHHVRCSSALAHLARRRARRTDADHQRQPARALRRASWPARREAHQRLARHARPGKVHAPSPAGAISPRCWPGIDAAQAAGLHVKINTVALKGVNEDEIRRPHPLGRTAAGMDLTLIETMPLGEIDGDRTDQYLPLSLVRARLDERCTLDDTDLPHRRPGALRARRARPAAGSASSRR